MAAASEASCEDCSPAIKATRSESNGAASASGPRFSTAEGAGGPLERAIANATLPPDFMLTDYTRLKGCSCKVPQDRLLALLRAAARLKPGDDVGMDCSIVAVKAPAVAAALGEPLYLVSTTDFFFPSVEDPLRQGHIGAANVLSDLFAMGITDCDSVLMMLGASTDMEQSERDAVSRDMMRGFVDKCREADVEVTGGQTVHNPWPLIGGVAMAVATESTMLRPVRMVAGDVLVLTKPLGTQLAVNVRQWTRRPSPLYKRCVEGRMGIDEVDALYEEAVAAMSRLNRDAARLMMKHGAHACTDVTGFGIVGHARNLALSQPASVRIVIDVLPIFAGAVKAEQLINGKYGLFEGRSAETSGGLLIAFPSLEVANAFRAELSNEAFQDSWIVGRVLPRVPGVEPPAAIDPRCDIMALAKPRLGGTLV